MGGLVTGVLFLFVAFILFTLAAILPCLGPQPLNGIGLGLGPGVSIEMMQLTWTP